MLSKLGVPSNALGNPDAAVQFLMDTGKISQEQYMQARQMAQGFFKR
jgi:hypothetical protein